MCESGSFSHARRFFQLWNESSGKNVRAFVSNSIVEVAGAVSRVKMNAKERRP